MESNLDPEVPCIFPFRDPLEPFLFTPLPGLFSLAGPDYSRLAPVDFGSGRVAKGLEDLLCHVHVGQGALQIKGCVINEGLIFDQATFGKREAFDPVFGVGQHVPQNVRSKDE